MNSNKRHLLKNRVISDLSWHFIHDIPIKKSREVFLVEVCAFASSLSC